MRMSPRRTERSQFEVVVTSMLDINFLLIMFFMMTAQFQRETSANLNLPQERGENEVQPDEAGLVINVLAGGEIVVSGRTVDLVELQTLVQRQVDHLAAADPRGLKLMLRADRDARSDDLNRVVEMLHAQGVGTIRIATETPI
jgi:biopolymer transport protein ExbD